MTLAVVMQRRETRNRWQPVNWEPLGVLVGTAEPGEPRLLVEEGGLQQWLHPGLAVELHRDEAEGCFLNVSSDSPRVFVMWRLEGEEAQGAEDERAVPVRLTVSLNEAERWFDAGHRVDGVPMPPEVLSWVGGWVEANYRPEPKKRVRPRSFLHPKDWMG
jgi:hypothetical protein